VNSAPGALPFKVVGTSAAVDQASTRSDDVALTIASRSRYPAADVRHFERRAPGPNYDLIVSVDVAAVVPLTVTCRIERSDQRRREAGHRESISPLTLFGTTVPETSFSADVDVPDAEASITSKPWRATRRVRYVSIEQRCRAWRWSARASGVRPRRHRLAAFPRGVSREPPVEASVDGSQPTGRSVPAAHAARARRMTHGRVAE